MSCDFPNICDFIQASPVAFHTAAFCQQLLERNGFTVLDESNGFGELVPGGKYCLRRGGSTIAAFVLPENFAADSDAAMRIIAAHTDSPALKVKVHAADWEKGNRLPVEVYGSPILSTWLDRPLKVACRTADFRNGKVEEMPVTIESPFAIIPNPAIHLADLNNGFKYNPQQQLAAIMPADGMAALKDLLDKHDAVEMWLCDAQPPVYQESADGFINAPRIDNLASCYAALKALCSSDPAAIRHIAIAVCFDLEECGDNFHSARGTLLDTLINAICRALHIPETSRPALTARSWMISADAAHGLNPNFTELYDSAYAPRIGQGIVLKSNPDQRYATTIAGEAFFQHCCRNAGIVFQRFAVRSDMRCGSTIGPGCALHTGIPAIDIGIPLWAMHSIRETACVNDMEDLAVFCTAVING